MVAAVCVCVWGLPLTAESDWLVEEAAARHTSKQANSRVLPRKSLDSVSVFSLRLSVAWNGTER